MPPSPMLPNLAQLGGLNMNFLPQINLPQDLSMFTTIPSSGGEQPSGEECGSNAYHDVSSATYLGLPYDPVHEGSNQAYISISSPLCNQTFPIIVIERWNPSSSCVSLTKECSVAHAEA